MKKLDHLSQEDFTNYWLKVHAPKIKQLPNIRKYVANPSTGQALTSRTVNPGYDGVAELYFDDLDAADGAFGSKEGKITRDDAKKFLKEAIFMVVNEITAA